MAKKKKNYNLLLYELQQEAVRNAAITGSKVSNSALEKQAQDEYLAPINNKRLAKNAAENTERKKKQEIITQAKENPKKSTTSKKSTKEEDRTWFSKGAFEDGYNFGDITKTILGTVGDVGLGAARGIYNMGEGISDVINYGIAGVDDLLGNDYRADVRRKRTMESSADKVFAPLEKDIDAISVIGEKGDSISQGLGYVGGIMATGGLGASAGLGTVGTTLLTTGVTGLSSMGSGMGEAYQGGATDEEALKYGIIAGVAEAGSELIFGGLGKAVNAVGLSKGLLSVDDALAKKISSTISSTLGKNLAEYTVKSGAEGVEEVISGIAQGIGKKMTYMSDEDLVEILKDENLLEQFVVGTVTSSIAQFPGLVKTTSEGKPFISENTQDNQVQIEGLQQEITKKTEELNKSQDAREKQIIQETINGLNEELNELTNAQQITDEKELRKQNFTYQAQENDSDIKKAIYESASQVMNNTEKAHKFVDVVAKIAEERGTIYKFTNNEQLKELGHIQEGMTTNGLVNENGEVLINIDSAKALNAVVGHETTHLLEGTKEYDALKQVAIEYAKTKGDYDARIETLTKLYEGTNADIEAELTSDIVGEYLFTDENFVKELSVKQPTIFEKIKNFISDLVVKFKGTDQEKQLRQLQRTFEKAYKAQGTQTTTDTKYSFLGEEMLKGNDDAMKLLREAKRMKNEGENTEYIRQSTGWTVAEDGNWKAEIDDSTSKLKQKLKKNQTYKLGDILDHKTLYALNDNYKNIEVRTMDMKANGGYSREIGGIALNNKILNNPNQVRSTLLHEMQHATQHAEDWKGGTSVKKAGSWEAYQNNYGEKEAREVQARQNMSFEDRMKKAPSTQSKVQYSLSTTDNQGRTLTKEQQEYFKDSKVRDEDGNLLTMYHGTSNDFTVFDADKIKIDNLGKGFYFTDNKDIAESYATRRTAERGGKERIVESYINSKKPFDLSYVDKNIAIDYLTYYFLNTDIIDRTEQQAREEAIDLIESETTPEDGDYSIWINTSDKNFQKWLKENNYDSIIVPGVDKRTGISGKAVVVFNSNQIKNVDNTNPTTNPDIRYSLSEDNQGRKLSKEQKEYFKNVIPELKDENGNLKVLYHGTPNEFTQFNYDFIGTNGTAFGKGFYLTDDINIAKSYTGNNGNVMELYANITNPMSLKEITISKNDFKKFVSEIAKQDEYWIYDYGDIDREGFNKVLNYAVDLNYDGETNDVDLIHGILNTSTLGWEEGFRVLNKTLGYDGVIANEFGEGKSNVYVPFFPEQIKAITNENPTTNPDINLSLSAENEEIAPTGNWHVRGEDIKLQVEEAIAPLQETINNLTEQVKTMQESFAPTSQEENEQQRQIEATTKDMPMYEKIEPLQSPVTRENTTSQQTIPMKVKTAQNGNTGLTETALEPELVEGKKRRWVGTSTESEVVNREVLPDDLDYNAVYYQPITNKDTLNTANAKLDGLGYEDSIKYFKNKILDKRTTVEDIALGERLIQEAIKKGDTKTAGDIIQDVAILGTELGQKVQALSIIQRMTPEGQLKMLEKTINRGKTKGDKAFTDIELTQEMKDKILNTYNEDGSYDQDKLNQVIDEVKQEVADQMKVTAMDKINEWRYLSMLGNPKTHIRNLVSNVAMKGTVAVKNALARTIETIAPIENRTKTWKATSDDVINFAKQTTLEMKDIISGDSKYSETADIKAKRKTFNSKFMNWLTDGNSNLLEKEDWWFSKGAFESSFREFLTANGIQTQQDIQNNPKLIKKAKNYAVEQAQIATFRQYSWLSNKIRDIESKNAATQIAVGAVLPFKKTPINIAKTGLSYSPLGFAKTLTYDIAQVQKGNMEASTLIDHIAQNTTGTALTLVGYMLAQSGFLNGAGDDDKEGKYDYQLGKQSYSINIGGSTYSLSWLSPVAMPLFVGANAFEQLVEGEEWNADVVMETLGQTLDPLSEMSFLSSLDSVLSSYDSGVQKFFGIGEAMAKNYITQFAPTASSQLAATLDDTKRTTKASGDSTFKIGEEIYNQLIYKIPGLRETLEPSTDIWGNEIKQSEGLFQRAFENFISPYARKDSIATEIDEELKDLYSQTGDTGLLPSIPYNYVNYDGEKYKMSAEEYTDYKKMYGQTANDLLEDLFRTTTYQRATSEDRVDMVNDVYEYAREESKLDYLAKEGVDYTNAKKDDEEYYKENLIKGAIENDMTTKEYSLYLEDPEEYKFLKEKDYEYRQQYFNTYDSLKELDKQYSEQKEKIDDDDELEELSKEKKANIVDQIINSQLEETEKASLYKKYYNTDTVDTIMKAAISVDDYLVYETKEFTADKNKKGNSIPGSRKDKVVNYVNTLDMSIAQKAILIKSTNTFKFNEYNEQIVRYVDGLGLPHNEVVSILKDLDMTVKDGYVYWD